VIAFGNSDSPLKLVDICIPCNNKGAKAIGLMLWMLAREVLLIRGRINRITGFVIDDKDIMPDLYFYRDPEEEEVKEEKPAEETTTVGVRDEWAGDVGGGGAANTEDLWTGQTPGVPKAAGGAVDFATITGDGGITDWAQQVEMQSWSNPPAGGGGAGVQEWGGTNPTGDSTW